MKSKQPKPKVSEFKLLVQTACAKMHIGVIDINIEKDDDDDMPGTNNFFVCNIQLHTCPGVWKQQTKLNDLLRKQIDQPLRIGYYEADKDTPHHMFQIDLLTLQEG